MRSEPSLVQTVLQPGLSLAHLRQVFGRLPLPPVAMRTGFYRARFIGPWWLRGSGPLGGLPGWQGKRFLAPDLATNVLLCRGRPIERFELHCTESASPINGRPSVLLDYGAQAPRPWRWVRDELRALDGDRLLGMTVIDLPGVRGQPFPFLLERPA
ncbi:MAG: hypothetical protein RBS27_02245 [Giesbergeria sp.]|jgi:hypothetical protein|nr:hypothetical protein [Giesbergeria sp.]